MNYSEDVVYKVALTLVKNLGPINARKLVSHCGGVKEVFEASKSGFKGIEGVRAKLIKDEFNDDLLEEAQKEVDFAEENGVSIYFYLDKEYPNRLKYCQDSPLVLYGKGNLKMNPGRMLSVVGTRRATPYGLDECEKIIGDLSDTGVTIVSGMAYGIDICAHKSALKNDLPTIGCLGHGLDRFYPSLHRSTAEKMMKNGGVISEFRKGTKPDAQNFPKRNRIVAGMADGVLVVESGHKGGSLITANLAFSYSRDVMALPGRVGDTYSIGCNRLIQEQKASLVQSADDVMRVMGWNRESVTPSSNQQKLFIDLTEEEERIVEALQSGKSAIDELSVESGIPMSKTSSLLLNMEFNGLVRSLPGKVYELC
ncbi:DNA-processing protein DprA [Halocola ammonii]